MCKDGLGVWLVGGDGSAYLLRSSEGGTTEQAAKKLPEQAFRARKVRQGLKPGVVFAAFTARLKPCPDLKNGRELL
jgi:hypothetical protein